MEDQRLPQRAVPAGRRRGSGADHPRVEPVTGVLDAANDPFWFNGQTNLSINPVVAAPKGGKTYKPGKLFNSGLPPEEGAAGPVPAEVQEDRQLQLLLRRASRDERHDQGGQEEQGDPVRQGGQEGAEQGDRPEARSGQPAHHRREPVADEHDPGGQRPPLGRHHLQVLPGRLEHQGRDDPDAADVAQHDRGPHVHVRADERPERLRRPARGEPDRTRDRPPGRVPERPAVRRHPALHRARTTGTGSSTPASWPAATPCSYPPAGR